MHRNLRSFLDLLRRENDLVTVDCEVDPYLEVAEIHRRVIERGGPPSTPTTASRELLAKNSFSPIAEEKTICFPSGEKRGLLSGPGCATIFFTESSLSFSR